jgi:DNA modification methylase
MTMTTTSPTLRPGEDRAVLRGLKADLILTSPPYNIGSKQPRVDGFRKHGGYDPKSYGAIRDYPDDLPEAEYQRQQRDFFLWAARHLEDDGVLVYNHKPRRRDAQMLHPGLWFLRPEVQAELQLMEEIIWDRHSTHNHSNRLMWPQTERLYVFRTASGTYPFLNHRDLPQRSDLWRIERSRAKGHNSPFPLDLAKAVIQAWSKPGDLVCDPYTGSGTTGIAALELGRRFVGAELLPRYYHHARERIEAA